MSDGSFRYLKEPEFSALSSIQKSKYLARASKELKKTVDELRAMVRKRDQESDT